MKIPTGDVFEFFSKIVNNATSDNNGNVVDAVSARVVDTEVPEKALRSGGKKKRGRPRKKDK